MVARTCSAHGSDGLGDGVLAGVGLLVVVVDERGDPPAADPQADASTTTRRRRAANRPRRGITDLTSKSPVGLSAHRIQPVAGAPDRHDLETERSETSQLFAQPSDVDVDRLAVAQVVVAPDLFEQDL